jgi:hypothetical protein
MRERDIERALVASVEAAGGLALKLVSPGRRGVPDRLCLFPRGRVLFVETKAPGKTLSVAQQRMAEQLRALGFRVEVIDDLAAAQAVSASRS